MACKDVGCLFCGGQAENNDRKAFPLKLKLGECSKCHQIKDNLLLSSYCTSHVREDEGRIFCQSCFRKSNKTHASNSIKCPCCSFIFCEHAQSLEECILIGEGNYTCYEARYQDGQDANAEFTYRVREKAIEKYEDALLLNPTNLRVKVC